MCPALVESILVFCMGRRGGSWWSSYSREHSSLAPRCQGFSWLRIFANLFDEPYLLGVFHDEDAAVSEVDFWGLPSLVGALVPEFEAVSRWRFVFVGWDPASDGLPGWVDGFEGFYIKGWF